MRKAIVLDPAKRTHGVTEILENADLNTYATEGSWLPFSGTWLTNG